MINSALRVMTVAQALFPSKFKIFCYPFFPWESKEEWLKIGQNQELLDASITLIKRMVDMCVVENVDVDI